LYWIRVNLTDPAAGVLTAGSLSGSVQVGAGSGLAPVGDGVEPAVPGMVTFSFAE
jgi:hypothetical protein